MSIPEMPPGSGEAERFTKRQLDCLQLTTEGHSSTEIGRRLQISARTVDDHLAMACRQLGVRTRIQAVAVAVTLGLVKPLGS
jgi:DNA-binding CsgD family transcriptional regulator